MSLPDPTSLRQYWEGASPFVVPPVAASVSIAPVFYGYYVKTARQLGNPKPSIRSLEFRHNLKKAVPTVGVIVGTQMVVQSVVEKALISIKGDRNEKSLSSLVLSSMMVGAVSAPLLAVFNGQSNNLGMMECLRKLSLHKSFVIAVRETSFIMGLTLSQTAAEPVKQHYGDSRLVVLGFAFFGGAVGGLFGHPADTLVTLWQNEKRLESVVHLTRGGVSRTLAVGGFSVIYKVMNDLFTPGCDRCSH